jgi:hypothetical protein
LADRLRVFVFDYTIASFYAPLRLRFQLFLLRCALLISSAAVSSIDFLCCFILITAFSSHRCSSI